jgi:triosephosphate isomerase
MRQFIIAGNWKMNMNNNETKSFLDDLKIKINNFEYNNKFDIIICPPFTSLRTAKESVEDSQIKIGAQNMFHLQS